MFSDVFIFTIIDSVQDAKSINEQLKSKVRNKYVYHQLTSEMGVFGEKKMKVLKCLNQ